MPETPPAARYRDTLEAAKRASALQLLFRAGRLLNERGVERVRARGREPASTAHTAVLPHIDLAGTRLTEIARRMRISKQAVNQTVAELERVGMVKRVPDPTDGRARLVRFTARGRRELLAGLDILGELQRDVAAAIGAKRMQRLHDDLIVLVDWLEDRD
jgi:DNA-binding MarR family transcriptional regulator